VFTIGGFSAHADQKGLLEWVSHFTTKSRPRVFVTHGEPISSEALARAIKKKFDLDVHVPEWKETLILKPREVVSEIIPAKAAPTDTDRDMLNTIIDLKKELDRLKKQLENKERKGTINEDDIDKLKDIQNEVKAILADQI
jgi:metallo-beta-lactamase family protein